MIFCLFTDRPDAFNSLFSIYKPHGLEDFMKSKVLVLSICLVVFSALPSHSTEANEVYFRMALFELNKDSRKAEKLIDEINNSQMQSPLMLSFLGAAQAHAAKATSNPFQKYIYIKRANKSLSKAILLENENLEIRFLRYSVQVQTPGIVGISKNVLEDKAFIISNLDSFNWDQLNAEIRSYIFEFMLYISDCTKEERFTIKRYLDEQADFPPGDI